MSFPIASSQTLPLAQPPLGGSLCASMPAVTPPSLHLPAGQTASTTQTPWPRYWPGSMPICPLNPAKGQQPANDDQQSRHHGLPTGLERTAHLPAHEAMGTATEMMDALAERALHF